MLHKLLPEYPEHVIRRSTYYQYRKPIDLYVATSNELDLLNKINAHHSHWTYARQPFTATDELVRVSDFLPFYEHLQLFYKSSSIPRTASAGSLRPILPQPQQPTQRSSDFVANIPNTARRNTNVPVATTSIQIQPYTAPEPPRENIPSISRPIAPAPAPSALRPSRPPKYSVQQFAARQSSQQFPTQSQQQLLPQSSTQQPIATSSNSVINSTNTGKEYIECNLQIFNNSIEIENLKRSKSNYLSSLILLSYSTFK
jgi:hypothetical protein